jgi:hypothetical protein
MIFPEFILTPVEHFWLLQTNEIIQGAINKGIDLVGWFMGNKTNPCHKISKRPKRMSKGSGVNTGHKSRYSSDWIGDGRINRRFFIADFFRGFFLYKYPFSVLFSAVPPSYLALDAWGEGEQAGERAQGQVGGLLAAGGQGQQAQEEIPWKRGFVRGG